MSVDPEELTATEQAVLLILSAEARPVPSLELAALGPKLGESNRERLVRLGFIDVIPGRPIAIELISNGWAVCAKLVDAHVPPPSSGRGSPSNTVLAALRRYVDVDGYFPRCRSAAWCR